MVTGVGAAPRGRRGACGGRNGNIYSFRLSAGIGGPHEIERLQRPRLGFAGPISLNSERNCGSFSGGMSRPKTPGNFSAIEGKADIGKLLQFFSV